MPELATKTNQLLDEMNSLRFKQHIDEFTLLRLEREVQKLLQIDPFNAYQFLGMLAVFREDIANVHKYYETASKLATTSGEKNILLNNYAASLCNMGYFSKAVKLSDDITDSSIEIVKPVKVFFSAGLFHRAANFIRKHSLENDNFIFAVEQFMNEHGVTDEQLQKLIEITISVLHKHQFFNFRNAVHIEFSSDESSIWLSYIIKVDRSIEEIVEMDYELACAIAEEDFPTDLLLHFIPVYEVAGE